MKITDVLDLDFKAEFDELVAEAERRQRFCGAHVFASNRCVYCGFSRAPKEPQAYKEIPCHNRRERREEAARERRSSRGRAAR